LIQATGREHIGQMGQVDHNDPPIHPLPHPNNVEAMRPYTESYEYDAVGNILAMIHHADGGSWTRYYRYATDSNRLLATSQPGDDPDGPYADTYEFNVHGSMTRMPHLPLMAWDFAERMQASSTQNFNDGTPETTYYVYDASGQRVRKVTERQAADGGTPTRMKERIYLGGFEIYREYDGTGVNVALERETLHIMDDKQRIALVETKTVDTSLPLTPNSSLVRYQLGNHLASASLELDDTAQIISYEECHPYGTTSYRAADSAIEASAKRYRYTGKEKDEENGLYYHGARYYPPWLGRWCSVDPLGAQTPAKSTYSSFANNPLFFIDPDGRQPKSGFIESMHHRREEINAELDNGVSAETARARGTELKALEMIDSLNNLVSMTEEDWADVLANIDLSDLDPGYLLEAWATKTVEEAAPAFLSEDPQEREVARGGLLFEFVVWSIGALAEVGPTTTLVKSFPDVRSPDAPSPRVVRAAGEVGEGITTPANGNPTSPGNPLPPDFIDNLADRPGSFNPNVAKNKLLDAAEENDTLLQRSHLGQEPFTPTTSPEITLSGHGVWEEGAGYTIVPENTWVNRFGPLGEILSNPEANMVEEGFLDPVWTYGPGKVVPNMRLFPPGDRISRLDMAGDPIFLNLAQQEGLLLSEILTPGLGPVNWAACARVR